MKQLFKTTIWILLFGTLLIGACQKSPEQNNQQSSTQQQTAGQTRESSQQQPAGQPSEQPQQVSGDAQSASQQLVPLEIKLPKPMFVGTPTNVAVPNLEKPLGKPRPPFLAPAGTKNIAFKKPVSGSDEQPIIGELSLITDGDKEAAEGSYVELGPKLQYVTIDLKSRNTIYAILVWHFHKQAVVYNDVIVQVADDPDFISNVQTIFNNDIDNSAGRGVGKEMSYIETSEGKLIDARGVQGRYVRLFSRGNSANELNHYIEVEVYGKAVQ
ncbi:MAG: hypothetical protein V1799_08290 [bacterium]